MKGKQFSACVLAIFFSIFSISPLSYSFGETFSGENTSGEKAGAFIQNFNIFLIEVFFSKITERPRSSESVPAKRILIKKQRIVLRSTEDNHLTLSLCPIISDDTLPQNHPVYTFFMQHNRYKKQSENFVSTYSGLSPPSHFTS